MDINQYKPTGDIKNKHFVTLIDYAPQEIFELLHSAVRLKKRLRGGIRTDVLKGKTIALIFAKSSTRTRVSFEMGIRQLGGHALFLSSADIQLGRGETIEDTVKTLERLGIEGIMIRTFAYSDVEKLCRAGKIPVINGLTDLCHPCQALADLLTIWEKKKRLEGLKLAYFGDGNNMANSLIVACAKSGIEIAVACPKDCLPDKTFIEEGKKCGKVTITGNPQEAADGADILYTDVFFSMGQHTDPVKKQALMPFQVNAALMKKAKPDAIFMHCLPAHRGEEVTADVIDSHASVIFDQAENRLHAQKAVLFHLFKER